MPRWSTAFLAMALLFPASAPADPPAQPPAKADEPAPKPPAPPKRRPVIVLLESPASRPARVQLPPDVRAQLPPWVQALLANTPPPGESAGTIWFDEGGREPGDAEIRFEWQFDPPDAGKPHAGDWFVFRAPSVEVQSDRLEDINPLLKKFGLAPLSAAEIDHLLKLGPDEERVVVQPRSPAEKPTPSPGAKLGEIERLLDRLDAELEKIEREARGKRKETPKADKDATREPF